MQPTKHIGKNVRNMRLLKGMKQATFAREMGIAQQNVSKMEKKKEISLEKLEAAAKVLGVSVEAIEKFNEKAVLNFAVDQQTGQIVHPVKEVIEYFKDELRKKDDKIEELLSELEDYRSGKKKPAKASKTGVAKGLHKVEGVKTAAQ